MMNRRLAARGLALGVFATGTGLASVARAGSYEDFFLGIALDRPGIVAPLLAKGFDVNARNPEGLHGLYIALRENSLDVAELLLKHPQLEVEATSPVGETLLMMAALRGRLDAMKQLIDRGAQINRPGWTPLHYAASGTEPAPTRLLLDLHAEIDPRAPNGNTPLMMAAGFGSVDAAELLALRGADVTLRNQAGLSAVDYARKADRSRLAERLEAIARRGRP